MALIALSLAAVLVSAAPKYTHESIRRELQGGDDPPSLPHPLQPGAALETKHSSRSQVVAEEEGGVVVVVVEAEEAEEAGEAEEAEEADSDAERRESESQGEAEAEEAHDGGVVSR